MGFCSEHEYQQFLEEVGSFEHLLTHDEMHFFKYYLDITKSEQNERLKERRTNPLKQWKLSPIDKKAQHEWDTYSEARDMMFAKTDFDYAPWRIVHCDSKKSARINIIKHFLSHVEYSGKDKEKLIYDRDIVFEFDPACYDKGLIAN